MSETARTCACGAELPRIERRMMDGETLVYESAVCFACAEGVIAEEEAAERAKHIGILLEKAGGGRFRDLSRETYPDDAEGQRVLAEALAWMDGDAPMLLLFGGVGSGKTGLAWALIRLACEAEKKAALVNFRDYLANLRLAYQLAEPADRLPHTVPLLCLDDIGAERPTDWARDELANLVEERYQHKRRTIVTSNYEPHELATRLGHDELLIGQRIVSRLIDGAVQIRFSGPDRRLT